MIKLRYMAGVALAAMAISSCTEDTLNVGQTLTGDSDQLNLVTGNFAVNTQTIVADSVLSLSNNCYFGKVKDPETGTNVTSEFATQFHLIENTYITAEDSIANKTDGRAVADSCDIVLYLSSPFRQKDSLTAMKMRVHELGRTIEEGRFYYSNFDPVALGMLRTDAGAINQGKLFTYKDLTISDSERSSTSYIANIRIPLNQPYQAGDGTVYSNYGTYIMRQYYEHKERFRNSYVFAHTVCPGFFFEVADGLGFHANVTDMGLRVFYTIRRDTLTRGVLVMAGTKEVLQTTRVTNDAKAISQLAGEGQHTYLKSPAGLFTQATIPVENIKRYVDPSGTSHSGDSLLAAKITFQRVNDMSSDDRMLAIPQSILMIERDSLTSFFEKNKLPDNKTSYIANYSSAYNTYTFTNISSLVTKLWNNRENGMRQDPQWLDKHPNWDKVVLVPVSYTTQSSTNTSIVSVEHDMSLTSTRLVGGPQNPDAINMSIVYAKFRE